MSKAILMTLVLASTFSTTFADEPGTEQVNKEREEWTRRYFAAQGTAVPDGGVTVLPEKQMSEYYTFKEQRAKSRASVQKYGYIKESVPDAQLLMKVSADTQQRRLASSSANSTEEGLRRSVGEIEMAYNFHGVPAHEMSIDLGVAPSVTYVKGRGWAGATQFFEKDGVGTCSYRENNLQFSHGAAVISEESSTKDVNGKVTVAAVTGQEGEGFMYSVNWYDNHYFRELNCARTTFSSATMKSVLKLAQSIDSHG